jgi:hypothetical protein
MYCGQFIALVLVAFMATGCGERATKESAVGEVEVESLVVEAACGQCQFGLPGHEYDLAVRIDGESYFVDGTDIDDHGDAHAEDGFCNAVRQARVTGHIEDGRFVATSFELLDDRIGD